MPEKGWFAIPGVREFGDRTIEEQMLGLDRALAEAKGKTVLDLGAAEGAISVEFAKAGASRVFAIEMLSGHMAIAKQICAAYPQIELQQAHLDNWIDDHDIPQQFDIVLTLGIIHKLHDPAKPLQWAARSCRDLLCFRAPARQEGLRAGYIIKSKHTDKVVNVPVTLETMGFVSEGIIKGARGEAVEYWRRKR